jgi:hypothetical protein
MKYADIVFLQNSSDFPLNWDDRTDQEKAQYLSQWDYGEYHSILKDYHSMMGQADRATKVFVENAGTYVLVENKSMGYAALFRELEDSYGRNKD